MGRFRAFSWLSLVLVIGVILWGAYVRASGSGAGCGSHWPTCNGEVLPREAGTKTLIELTHRVTSGLAALAVLAQLIWSRRVAAKGHPLRRATGMAAFFMITEVLIGAGIVLLQYVADDMSTGRAVWMAIHLVNTFLLMGAMTLTVHHARPDSQPLSFAGPLGWLAIGAVVGTLLVGMSGAVAALGDTLFPASDLGTALADDLSPTAHVLVRLRVVHPFVAVGVAFMLLAVRHVVDGRRGGQPGVSFWGLMLRVTVVGQMAAGLVNMMLLAPIWMQIVHLLLADVLWIALVMFLGSAFGQRAEEPALERAEQPA